MQFCPKLLQMCLVSALKCSFEVHLNSILLWLAYVKVGHVTQTPCTCENSIRRPSQPVISIYKGKPSSLNHVECHVVAAPPWLCIVVDTLCSYSFLAQLLAPRTIPKLTCSLTPLQYIWCGSCWNKGRIVVCEAAPLVSAAMGKLAGTHPNAC